MERILYLPIETIARELDAKLLLAHRALFRGYSVIIGHKSNVFKAAKQLGYGIYFSKDHDIESSPILRISNDYGLIRTALDEEGLTFIDDKFYLDRAKPQKLEHLKIVFTWGSYQRNLLVKENPSLETKVVAVGNPRFDLLRPEFKPFYESAREKIKKTWGSYFLINTRFQAGNFSRNYGCNYLEYQENSSIKNRGRSLLEEERYFFLERGKYYKKKFDQYSEMLTMLSLRYPDLNFILRPHPSEDHENWKEALKGLKNVHVIFEGSAIDWINGALAVIHTGCTTGIESWALQKPVIIYNPDPNDIYETALPNKFGVGVTNVDELYGVLENIIAGKFQDTFEKQSEVAFPFIESIKGKLSAERIMDALDNLPDIPTDVFDGTGKSIQKKLKDMESKKRAIKFQIIKWLLKYHLIIRKFAGKRAHNFIIDKFKNQFQKFPGLSTKSVYEKLLIFDLIFPNKHTNNYSVKRIATDTYLIDK